jgi:hypothetical protein
MQNFNFDPFIGPLFIVEFVAREDVNAMKLRNIMNEGYYL